MSAIRNGSPNSHVLALLRGSFIPPKDLRELRLVSRYRRKLVQALAGEKNRLHGDHRGHMAGQFPEGAALRVERRWQPQRDRRPHMPSHLAQA